MKQIWNIMVLMSMSVIIHLMIRLAITPSFAVVA